MNESNGLKLKVKNHLNSSLDPTLATAAVEFTARAGFLLNSGILIRFILV